MAGPGAVFFGPVRLGVGVVAGIGAGAGICLELEPEPKISKMGGFGNPARFTTLGYLHQKLLVLILTDIGI